MRRLGVKGRLAAATVGALALLVAGAVLAFAVNAGATPLGALDDTTQPVTTTPAPDPAPAPKPAPKPTPKPKPAPKPAPTHTYSAPTRTYSAPTYTPPPRASSTPKSTRPRVVTKPKPRHKKAKKPAVTTTRPVETTPVPAIVVPVPVGARQAPAQAAGDAAIRSVLFIGGVSFAALLFLLAATLPGTPARFTPVGRVVIDHQQDLVLVGLATFVITVSVYLLTGHG